MRSISHFAIPAFAFAIGFASTAYAEPAGQYVDDAAITTKIKAAIATDKVLKNTNVSVTTTNGTVNLAGTVVTKTQEAEVVKIANKTNGVTSVNDTVQVQSGGASTTSED